MSEYDLETILDDEDDSTTDLPKALRRKIKELQKEISEMRDENTTLRSAERKRTIGATLQEKGLNPKIAAFIPQDLEGEQIDEWLNEYGDVFGQPVASGEAQEPVIARDAAEAAAIRQMAAAEQGATPAAAQDLLSQINNAESMADLMSALGR